MQVQRYQQYLQESSAVVAQQSLEFLGGAFVQVFALLFERLNPLLENFVGTIIDAPTEGAGGAASRITNSGVAPGGGRAAGGALTRADESEADAELALEQKKLQRAQQSRRTTDQQLYNEQQQRSNSSGRSSQPPTPRGAAPLSSRTTGSASSRVSGSSSSRVSGSSSSRLSTPSPRPAALSRAAAAAGGGAVPHSSDNSSNSAPSHMPPALPPHTTEQTLPASEQLYKQQLTAEAAEGLPSPPMVSRKQQLPPSTAQQITAEVEVSAPEQITLEQSQSQSSPLLSSTAANSSIYELPPAVEDNKVDLVNSSNNTTAEIVAGVVDADDSANAHDLPNAAESIVTVAGIESDVDHVVAIQEETEQLANTCVSAPETLESEINVEGSDDTHSNFNINSSSGGDGDGCDTAAGSNEIVTALEAITLAEETLKLSKSRDQSGVANDEPDSSGSISNA